MQPKPRASAQPEQMRSKQSDNLTASRRELQIGFDGDVIDGTYFAHLLLLYIRRGYHITVHCTADKRVLFQAAGARTTTDRVAPTHRWERVTEKPYEGHGQFWQGHQVAQHISRPPLPNIGTVEELWSECCSASIDIGPFLPHAVKQVVRRWLEPLLRPIVLVDLASRTPGRALYLSDSELSQFYRLFLDRCDGTLILLEGNCIPPGLDCYRLRHVDQLGTWSTEVLLALLTQSDLLIGVDHGPLHAARFSKVATLGIWLPDRYPATCTLPRPQQVNLVLADHTGTWNRYKRIAWNLVEHPGAAFGPKHLADDCQRMLSPPRYLRRSDIAADIQLQQFVQQWCRGGQGNGLCTYCDRNRSLDVLLREMGRRFEAPTVVETGTMRAEEDWAGAGLFTYLAGAFLYRHGGRLYSVDICEQNCLFSRAWTDVFGETVTIAHQDSVQFLHEFHAAIDVLYLDSLDATEPGHAEHALAELQAALPNLHQNSLVVFDDTPFRGGVWVGKGALGVPYLLQHGWRLLYAGYQAVLHRGFAP